MKLHTDQIQKLKEERAENETKINQLTHQNERLKAREQYLIKKERDGRTHRLCITGGIVESILPEIKTLTQAEQYALMERILHLPEAERLIQKILADHERKARWAEEGQVNRPQGVKLAPCGDDGMVGDRDGTVSSEC